MKPREPIVHIWLLYPPNVAPSQRFRVELFVPVLNEHNINYKMHYFFDKSAWADLYVNGRYVQKLFGVMRGFARRFVSLFKSGEADYIFILREAVPVGPPLFEWFLSRILRKKIIYDFDDAIWIPGGEKISALKKFLKATWKIKHIIRWSYKVSAGNQFLANYALQYNNNVVIIPTVVDTRHGHHLLKDQDEPGKIVIGWTGSHTTLHNLDEIKPVIPKLKENFDFDFLIISNRKPNLDFDFIYKKWEAATELSDLLMMNIGVMPLKRGPWFEGKCGFKLIQYLSCGIPAVASPVGVNDKIALHKQTGFIASSEVDWIKYLSDLLHDASLRKKMGRAGREHIEANYSLSSQALPFISLFS